MTNDIDLSARIAFIREIDRLKGVYRQALVRDDNNRFENSAEHSWQITLAAIVLKDYAEQRIDLIRVLHMLLIHDIVEIDAGDTFAFVDDALHAQQETVELAAAERIFGLLPKQQYAQTLSLWKEFERCETADAQFAKSIDRILPLIQNMQNQGGSWKRHNVAQSKVLKRNQYLQKSAPKLWQYVQAQVALATQQGWLRED